MDFRPTPRAAWLFLFLAGCFEIAWALGLKYAQGFTRPVPSLLTIAAMVASFLFLAQALRAIPLGTAYAVWTGIGAFGTAMLGIILFDEPAGFWRLFCLLLIIGGIFGLKLASPG